MPSRSPAGGSVSRRTLLTGAATALGLVALPGVALATAPDRVRNGLVRGRTFPDWVSSGLVSTDRATLWTRVAGGGPGDRLQLLVSRRSDLSSPIQVSEVGPDPGGDGTLHASFHRGEPGEEYYYGFQTADAASDVGRFRMPRPAESAEPTRIGFFTCQSYVDGYFGAHHHLADEDLDLVVCLGDYIYENGGIGPGGRVDAIGLGVLPYVGLGWLINYRNKYRLYRTDPAMRRLHATHAMLPIFDDHEVQNDWWRDGTLGNAALVPARFEAQKRGALRAWSENMPVPLAPSPDHPLLRHAIRLGRHTELFSYDARSFRDAQPCHDIGGSVCADADTPGRTMLGAAGKRSLLDALTGSSATWQVLANQNMMMGMVTGDSGRRANYDCWDGYGAERTEILSELAQHGRNLLVVTGDDHDTYAGELWNTGFASTGTGRAGVEFVVPSLTTLNTADVCGVSGAHTEERNRLDRNAHVKLADLVQHGYGVMRTTGSEASFAFRAVDKHNPDPSVSTPYEIDVEPGTGRLAGATP